MNIQPSMPLYYLPWLSWEYLELGILLQLIISCYAMFMQNIKNAIATLSAETLQKILDSDLTPEEQKEKIKSVARQNLRRTIIENTVKAGASGSLFYALIIAVILGPLAPWAGIAVAVGMLVTAYFARRNDIRLRESINSFIKSDAIDQIVVAKIDLHNASKQQNVTLAQQTYWSNIRNYTKKSISYANLSTSFLSLVLIPLTPIAPIFFAIYSVFATTIQFFEGFKFIRANHPDAKPLMHNAAAIDIEHVSLACFNRKPSPLYGIIPANFLNLTRNHFNSYLLEEIKISKLKKNLKSS